MRQEIWKARRFVDSPGLDAMAERSLLYQAWEKVRSNGGCRGCDGVTVKQFTERLEYQLDSLEDSLHRRCYRPLPLMKFSVPKRNGGRRFLAVPTVRDRLLQTAVYLQIRDRLEREFEDCSFAYRPGRSVRDALRRIRDLRIEGYRFVVDADIHGYFRSISHERLFERVSELDLPEDLVRVLRLWVGAEIYDGLSVSTLKKGLPQGSPVSPLLANLFLDSLDEAILAAGHRLVRYADDCAPRRRREEVFM